MRILLVALCVLINTALAHRLEPQSSHKAHAFAHAKNLPTRKHPWPFSPLSVGHNMQSYQNYGFSAGSAYWHDGLDIRGNQNEIVVAAAGGQVVNIENYVRGNPLYWEVAILDSEGFVWKYHHIEKDSIPTEIHAAYRNRSQIPAGTVIGNLVTWPETSFGERYHHVHLLVVDGQGRYVNPFLLLQDLPDTQGPQIAKIGILKNFRAQNSTSVSGDHALYAEVGDLFLHDKFILPPYEISYQLDRGPKVVTWKFDYLPSMTNDKDYINDFYASGTCGNYSCRKILINLMFTPNSPRATINLPRGSHQIDVEVKDVAGNSSSQSFSWTVQ